MFPAGRMRLVDRDRRVSEENVAGREHIMRSAIKEILETILLTLLIFLAVRMVVQNFRVEGSSMEPSLHSGQYLLVNKAVYFNVETDEVNRLLPFLKLPSGEAVFP